MFRRDELNGEPNKKKLDSTKLSFKINKSETGDFAEAYIKAEALLRFYFKLTDQDIEKMSEEDFALRYNQLIYALEFDAARSNADSKQKVYLPM